MSRMYHSLDTRHVLARIDHREVESRLGKVLLVVFSEQSGHYKSQSTHRILEVQSVLVTFSFI